MKWEQIGSSGLSELHYLSATELAHLIATRQVSAVEVVQAHLDRIEQVNPRVNAIVTLVAEQALEAAAVADASDPAGPLHGLPVAHKDLVDTAGIRTTYGSPFFSDHVPTSDGLIVTRMRAAGAVTV